jgi:DsbC/DsbD-like thiol-disulfide interchange protein
MSSTRTHLWLSAALAVVADVPALGSAQAQGLTQVSHTSDWVQLHNARVRLLAGAPATKGAKAYLAGLEITMAEGWKTYWRMPGDAGVPPTFDWAGSTNVRAIEVRYPAPMRLPEPAAETIGYKRSVIFPVAVTPQDAARPVELKLAIEFGVCRDICVPAEAKFSLVLAPAEMAGEPLAAVRAALERVPRRAAGRRASDPELGRVTATLDGAAPRLAIEARFARGSEGADLFIEAPDGIYVPLPKRLPDAADGTARFEVDLARGGNAKELKGKVLTLTLVSSAGASETTWTVP